VHRGAVITIGLAPDADFMTSHSVKMLNHAFRLLSEVVRMKDHKLAFSFNQEQLFSFNETMLNGLKYYFIKNLLMNLRLLKPPPSVLTEVGLMMHQIARMELLLNPSII
jgi:hypothetical protein